MFLVLFSVHVQQHSAYQYTKCEIAAILKENKFSNIEDWVCLIEKESTFFTNKVNNKNKDGTSDFGLFQINSGYWCKIGSVGGDCNADCNSFSDDNISDDIKCVKLIYKRHKFTAWNGWKDKCKGRIPKGYLNDCNPSTPKLKVKTVKTQSPQKQKSAPQPQKKQAPQKIVKAKQKSTRRTA